ncbi:MAG TPA: zf-HC2 domain-containing protein [Pseudonocardia sp.]|nr:zf-HC2 domain-containing protein [Pseudonocardia sp.]
MKLSSLPRGVPRMIRCLRASRALQSYLDGEAGELTVRQVEAHLEECRRCGLRADTYRAIKKTLRSTGGGADQLALRRLRAFSRRLAEADGPDT